MKVYKLIFLFVLFVSVYLLLLNRSYFLTNNSSIVDKISNTKDEKLPTVEINETQITVEIAKTSEEFDRGLSGREYLPENHGMLFMFDYKNTYPIFWMKDMKFPLDIIWIDKGSIVDISKNVPNPAPESSTNLPLYKPRKPADSVLEVNAGFTDKHNIQIGDQVNFKLDN